MLLDYKKYFFMVIKKSMALILIFLPFCSMHAVALYDFFIANIGREDASGGATFGNLDGGILYMMFMWFAWPIYVIWEDRAIWNFADYYHFFVVKISPFFLYVLIAIDFIKNPIKKDYLIYALLLLLFLFISKGNQPPFGNIFVWLIENVPGFLVFRSPDSKAGFIIVLSLALLILGSSYRKSKYFAMLVLTVSIVQSYPLLSGLAIKGSFSDSDDNRVVTISDEYKQIADFINAPYREYGYIFPFPNHNFTKFRMGGRKLHHGQDLLPKVINMPFVYFGSHSGMPGFKYNYYQDIVNTMEFDKMESFGIRYFIFRRDLEKEYLPIREYWSRNYDLVFENSLFDVFENKEAPKIIEGEVANVNIHDNSFNYVNNNKSKEIILHQNYHPGWVIYKVDDNCYFEIEEDTWLYNFLCDTEYLFKDKWDKAKKNITISNNSWQIDTNISSKKQTNLKLLFYPQLIFNLSMIVSLFFITIYSALLIIVMMRSKKINKNRKI